jgi:Na+-transporting methylmalonyl-CoA/oxaloacetate decarboxylase beta subunit
MMVLCFNTLATEADVSYFALLPHHVGMDVVGVIGSDWVLI